MNTNTYHQLSLTIDQLQKQGKLVKVIKLPSTYNIKRKSHL